ncbi:MAG: alkaline phosphatase family protein [Acidobacteria bacterium]|nr:alkaline phosphatase family protein [Acidobacteriota bacterium]
MSIRPFLAALLLTSGLASACASAAPPAAVTTPATSAAPRPAATTDRQRWLEMFARGYFPGRSGQVFVIPREGDVITDRSPMYAFMHGSPWEYDVHIPLLIYGPGLVTAGDYPRAATQQDVAPTLAALMGARMPPTVSGRALTEAMRAGAPRPRVVVLIALDGMRADYFDKYADVLPTLTRLRKEGAWFRNTRINYLPTLTSVGHATIGTGADPAVHGLAANNLFNRATGRPQEAYAGLDPGEMMALTLADVWNLTTDGRAIIVGQGGAIRATAGLLGHGACLVGARPVIAASYATRDAGWETNPRCYRLPDYLKSINGRTFWEAAGGTWMTHAIANPGAFRASSVFQRFEGEALAAVATNEAFGADDITDLLMVNTKGPDYVGHAYGPDSPEMRAEMVELDRQISRLLDILTPKAGPNGLVVALTADHGMPGEPPPGRRIYLEDIIERIHARFDPQDKKVVTYYGDAANNQVFLDTERLRSLGFTLKDVATMLEGEPYFVAAFTEDEVRAARR